MTSLLQSRSPYLQIGSTETPEPASFVLLGLGASCLIFLRSRRSV